MPPRVVFVVPGSLETRTGGSIYDRRMVQGLRQHGWSVDVVELSGTFPFLSPAALTGADCAVRAIPDGTLTLVDGLALGAMPEIVVREASRLRLVSLVHLPLGADVSFNRETAAALAADERRALHAAALVIATGTPTLRWLSEYGLPADRMLVVPPGTDRAPLASGSGGPSVSLLSVAALHRGKGHEVLIEALARVPVGARWRLVCAGSLTRDPPTVARVHAAVQRHGVANRVVLPGELEGAALADCYDRADVFVLATWQETYGMAVAEALARGLPVVSTTTGAIPDLVGEAAGLLVPAGNIDALASALTRVLTDADLRARLAQGARRVRDRLPEWQHASAALAAALASVEPR
jgi:glycosyltransferase involved in cell wall biosynthesis